MYTKQFFSKNITEPVTYGLSYWLVSSNQLAWLLRYSYTNQSTSDWGEL